jgi:hypothetical protein
LLTTQFWLVGKIVLIQIREHKRDVLLPLLLSTSVPDLSTEKFRTA